MYRAACRCRASYSLQMAAKMPYIDIVLYRQIGIECVPSMYRPIHQTPEFDNTNNSMDYMINLTKACLGPRFQRSADMLYVNFKNHTYI